MNKGEYAYVLTYSFPCTDLSIAGKQAGMDRDSGTRSGLLWQVERVLQECYELHKKDNTYGMPDVLVMENVTEVHGYKNKANFEEWVSFLEGLGYSNYMQDLNAADFGVAQHRERCFMVSILGNYNYKFPNPIPLKRVMADYLEDEVDDRYYLKSQKAYDLIVKLVDNGIIGTENALNERTNERTNRQLCVDGTINEPGQRDIANCIKAGCRGVVNHRNEENAVVEQSRVH